MSDGPVPALSAWIMPHVHARYTRIDILAACRKGEGAGVMPWQIGVLYVEELPANLLAFSHSIEAHLLRLLLQRPSTSIKCRGPARPTRRVSRVPASEGAGHNLDTGSRKPVLP